jgi:hypothetical protein
VTSDSSIAAGQVFCDVAPFRLVTTFRQIAPPTSAGSRNSRKDFWTAWHFASPSRSRHEILRNVGNCLPVETAERPFVIVTAVWLFLSSHVHDCFL